MKVVIVIPTYNEEANIGRFLSALISVFKQYPEYNWNVLVVDGNSPDKTQELVRKVSSLDNRIHLLVEKEKNGLGAAYVYGFNYATKEMGADVLVEMDADFQHDPKDLIKLVKAIDEGNDYVIGSRYISGGGIPQEWAFYRKFLSVGGNIFTRLVLGIWNVKDFTSGFKASRVKGFVDKLDFSTLTSKGFAYKMDLLYRMHTLGAKFKEVPIVFKLRDRGDSKMERDNFLDSLKVVLLIRFQKSKNFLKFAIVGVIGLSTDSILFNLLRIVLKNSTVASLISGIIAIFTTFVLNNIWSFRERKISGIKEKIYSIIIYVASSCVPILVRTKLVAMVVTKFGDTILVSNIAFFIGVLFGLVWNYTVYSRIIWKKK